MLAVATQTALRTNAIAVSPSSALARAAGFLDDDLRRTNASITLAYMHVDLVSGDYQFADAGHGLHFILRGVQKSVEHVTSEDMPMGVGDVVVGVRPRNLASGRCDRVGQPWGDGVMGRHLRGAPECRRPMRGGKPRRPQGLIEALCARADALSDRDDVTAVMLHRDWADV